METLVDEKAVISQLAEDYLSVSRNAFYIGRSNDYYVSMEAALKLKEISFIFKQKDFAAGELETWNHRTDRRRNPSHRNHH